MPVHSLCFRVSGGSFLTIVLNFVAKRSNFAVKMHVQVVTPRNRLEVLLLVLVVRYLLCCGDIELKPGPFGRETDKHTTQDPQEETATTQGDKARVNPQTVSGHTDEICVQSVPTDIDQDMALRILEVIQQQNEKFQSLQISINLMRDDMEAVKTDISHVRIKCEEIGRRCDRIEKEHSELSMKIQVNKSETEELFDTNKQKNRDETAKISSAVRGMEDEMVKLMSEVERLEEFSRKDSLKMFGIPHSGDSSFEDYDT